MKPRRSFDEVIHAASDVLDGPLRAIDCDYLLIAWDSERCRYSVSTNVHPDKFAPYLEEFQKMAAAEREAMVDAWNRCEEGA